MFRVATGAAPRARRQPLHGDFPEWSNRELEQSLSEKLTSASLDADRKPRFEATLRVVRRLWVESRIAGAFDEADDVAHDTQVRSIGQAWSAIEGLRAAPRETTTEARRLLEADAADALWKHRSAWARAMDTGISSLAALGGGAPEATLEHLHGRPLGPRCDDAALLLRETDDAYLDLLAFVLKRVDPKLRPQNACLADVAHALAGPWVVDAFRKEDLRHAMTRCLEAMGLHPAADGHIRIHAGASTSDLFDVSVPDDVRLTLHETDGFDGYAAVFNAWGTAQHRARVSDSLHTTERFFGDQAVPAAMGLVFEALPLDEKFLAWALRLPASRARESARAYAFRQLALLRREAAMLLASRALLRSGPTPGSFDDFTSQVTSALHVAVPRGHLLVEASLFLDGAPRLDAWALAHAQFEHVRGRFNEDFWRNPAAGAWLATTAGLGQRDDAVKTAERLGATLQLAGVARHRVSVMGA
ncbi:MAG: hypothetical protein JNG84_13540 [Archangium sp.]|nr:hypothetical protein [Archangium sp.]